MSTDQKLVIKIQAQADKATQEINKLNKELDKMSKSTKNANASSKNVSAGFKGINASASQLSGTLKGLAAAYLSIEGAKSLVSTAAEVEEGFLGVAKTTGLAGEEMDKFKQKLFDMSTELAGVSVGGLQQIAETAGQLGITGTDNILEFTRVISMMASTTELSAEEAAAAMAQLGNSLKIPVGEYENLASSINELSNSTTASAGDIIRYTQRIAGMGKTFGLTNTEILALSSTLKDVGISAELGGTAVNTMMMKMLQDTEGFAKVAGKSMEEYANIIKTEPVQAIELFLQSLDKMDKNTKIKTLDELKLSSSGAMQTMLKLSGATDLLTKSINTSTTAWEKNISIQNEYDTFSKGFNAQMERAKNAITVLASEIGDALLPKLKELIDTFVEWVNTLDDAKIKKFASDISDLAGGFADIITTIGGFIVSLGAIAAENPKLTVAILGTVAALKTLNGAMLLFGARTATAAGSMTPFIASSASMTSALGSMWKALNVVIMAAGPWGVALAGMAAATAGLVAVSDNYAESLKAAAAADMESANKMEQHTGAIEGIGEMYKQADEETAQYGNTTKETHDKIEQALNAEIKAIEKQLNAWNKTGDMTKLQEKNFFALAETVGTLKAKLDTLDADYSINVELETLQADAEYMSLLEKVQTPMSTALGFDPDTSDADRAREDVSKPIVVPVTYVQTNSPSGGASGASVSGLASAMLSSFSMPSMSMASGRGMAKAGAQNPVQSNGPGLGDLGTLTLKFGDQSGEALVPREVATALQAYIENEGGF